MCHDLEVVFRINQSALLECFSLWVKHGSSSSGFLQVLFAIVWLAEAAQLIGSPEPCMARWLTNSFPPTGQRQPWSSWPWLHLLATAVHGPCGCQGCGSGREAADLGGDGSSGAHAAGRADLSHLQPGLRLPQASQRLRWGQGGHAPNASSQVTVVSWGSCSIVSAMTHPARSQA